MKRPDSPRPPAPTTQPISGCPVHVAIIADVPWPTGSAGTVRVSRIAAALSSMGHRVSVFPIGHYGSVDPQSSSSIFDLHAQNRFLTKFGVLGRQGIWRAIGIWRSLHKLRPDWVLFYGRRATTVGCCSLFLPKKARLAIDLVEHPCITLWERGSLSVMGWDHYLGARWLLWRASLVLAITPNLAARAECWSKAEVAILLGITDAPGMPLGDRPSKFGYFGNWEAKDDGMCVARLAAEVLRSNRVLKFETIGRPPPESVVAVFREAGVEDRVISLGFVPDGSLSGVLSRWRLALLPRSAVGSTGFSFPNRAADLLSCGVPVAVRRAIGIGGLLEADGLVLLDGSIGEMAKTILPVLCDGSEFNRKSLESYLAALRLSVEGESVSEVMQKFGHI